MDNLQKIASGILIALGLAVVTTHPGQSQTPPQPRPAATGREPGPSVYKLEDAYLNWPVAPSERVYTAIDGKHLHDYVSEIAAISRRYRDRGHPQFWGRIEGTSADAESSQWVFDKLKKAGLTDVRTQWFDLPPQWMPQSWDVTAVGSGRTIKLESAQPAARALGTAKGGIDLEAIYVGLGNAADFAGRNVRGKAVFIYSIPEPGVWANSANFNGAVKRAEDGGAAAVFVVICLPGNIRTEFPILRAPLGSTQASATKPGQPPALDPGKIPEFTMGYEDGEAMRELIEQASADRPAHAKVRLDVQMVPGLKSSNVWGVLPGATDEKVMIIAHRDGYFEGSGDNASGMATMIGLAEYFAKLPKEKRRRTIEFVGTTGHHSTPIGVQWMADNRETVFAKTALLINAEHTALTQQYFFAGKMRAANTVNAEHWYFNGSGRLTDIAIKAFNAFGVPTYEGTDRVAMAEISRVYQLVPSFGVINVDTYYHTDHESPETVPWTGLASITRAFAKIVDDVNKVDIRDLQPPQSPSASAARPASAGPRAR